MRNRTGCASSNSMCVTELNSTTLKRSPDRRRSRAIKSAFFASLMDVPSIEPDVSMTKTVSRGSRTLVLGAGGMIIISA